MNSGSGPTTEEIVAVNREGIKRDYDHFCALLWQECEAWMDSPENQQSMESGVGPYASFWHLQSDIIGQLSLLERFNRRLMFGRSEKNSGAVAKAFGRAVARLSLAAMMAYSRRRRDVARRVEARMTRQKGAA